MENFWKILRKPEEILLKTALKKSEESLTP